MSGSSLNRRGGERGMVPKLTAKSVWGAGSRARFGAGCSGAYWNWSMIPWTAKSFCTFAYRRSVLQPTLPAVIPIHVLVLLWSRLATAGAGLFGCW